MNKAAFLAVLFFYLLQSWQRIKARALLNSIPAYWTFTLMQCTLSNDYSKLLCFENAFSLSISFFSA